MLPSAFESHKSGQFSSSPFVFTVRTTVAVSFETRILFNNHRRQSISGPRGTVIATAGGPTPDKVDRAHTAVKFPRRRPLQHTRDLYHISGGWTRMCVCMCKGSSCIINSRTRGNGKEERRRKSKRKKGRGKKKRKNNIIQRGENAFPAKAHTQTITVS